MIASPGTYSENYISKIAEIDLMQTKEIIRILKLVQVRKVKGVRFYSYEDTMKIVNFANMSGKQNVEIIEIPRDVVREIIYFIFPSKLNYTKLEDL